MFTQFDCLSPASADQTHSSTATQPNFEPKLDDSDSSPSNTQPEQGDGDQARHASRLWWQQTRRIQIPE